jgi:hypothetical protein
MIAGVGLVITNTPRQKILDFVIRDPLASSALRGESTVHDSSGLFLQEGR